MASPESQEPMDSSPYEEAILRRRSDPEQAEYLRWCYLDEPIMAARRFTSSEEFAEVRRILSLKGGGKGLRILDVGSGNGIAAFAFASLGCDVVAVEPDSSHVVGTGAMAGVLPFLTDGSITSVGLPVGEYRDPGNGFDIVYMRQVAHHFPVLEEGVTRCVELLKPGGRFLMTREHVADTPQDVEIFKQKHPGTRFGIQEQAYPASQYREALRDAGLVGIREWGPFESVINYFPTPSDAVRDKAEGMMRDRFGWLGAWLSRHLPAVKRWAYRRLSDRNRNPGRLFAFFGVKPSSSRAKTRSSLEMKEGGSP